MDQYSDCPDGSDEDIVYINHPLCQYDRRQCTSQMLGVYSNNFYQCLSGECINWHRVCDGNFDCHNGSDEYNCKHMDIKPATKEGIFRCDDDETIPASWVNDLIPDCGNAADELGYAFNTFTCKSVLDVPCDEGRSKCFPLSHICVYDHDQYGHLMHCRNGAHLTHCTEVNCPTRFKCTHSYCIPLRKLCDSVIDCPSGEDEWSCGDSLMCPGFFRCKGGVCIHPKEVCDGRNDCPHGEDEMNCTRSECSSECLCLGLAIFCKPFSDTNIYLNSFKSLHMMYIDLHKIPHLVNCSNLINITFSDGNVKLLKAYSFSGCDNVLFLHFVNTSIRSIQPRTFFGLASVEHLLIDGNLLTVIEPYTFEGMESLSTLDLMNLGVKYINSGSFYGLDNLMKLNLSLNAIKHFPMEHLTYLPELRYLDISHNPITNISYIHWNLSYQINLSVSQPFLCCQSNLFYCQYHFTKSICKEQLSFSRLLFFRIYGLFVTLGNLTVVAILVKSIEGKLRLVNVYLLIVFGLDSLQGVYILMASTKDTVFDLPDGGIHIKGERKHMFCVSAGLLQVLSAMTVSAITHTHYFYNQSSMQTSLARSVRLGLNIFYHITSIVCVVVLFLTNISHIDPAAFCSFLGVASNWEDWEAGVMIYLVIHGLISNTETIVLTFKNDYSRIRSDETVSTRVSRKKPFVRTLVRALLAITADLAWLVLLSLQYIHGPVHPVSVIVVSVIYTLPAAINPVIHLLTGFLPD